MNEPPNRRVLCVDDEPNVLDAFRRTLRKDFDIAVADGGEAALEIVRNDGPFAVVLSDMRMPGMNGIEFLKRLKEQEPDTVRMMLTGNSDQQTAIDAVNAGSIFRFMTKPCVPEHLAANLSAGIEQYRLITAEKDLLQKTLNQSLQVMLDILSIVNPTAFNRSGRVKETVAQISEKLGIQRVWEVEFAAMLSQIGCVAVPEEILEKVADGSPLSNRDTGLYNQHPQVGRDLIARIPRLENVAEIVGNQNRRAAADGTPLTENDLASAILHAALDHDRLVLGGLTPELAYETMIGRAGVYEPRVLNALAQTISNNGATYESAELSVAELRPGMYLDGPLVSLRGSILLPARQEITTSLILRLKNFVETGILKDRISVAVPAGIGFHAAAFQPPAPRAAETAFTS